MDEIRTVLSSYWTWAAIASGAFIGVWWARMTPTTANLTLVIGIIAAGVAVLCLPWTANHPLPVRVLWAITISGVLSLALYYTLWEKSPSRMQQVRDETTAAATSSPTPPQTKTLHELWEFDFNKTRMMTTRRMDTNRGYKYEIEVMIVGDFDTKTYLLNVFLPRSDDATEAACKFIADHSSELWNAPELLAGTIHRKPGEQEEKWSELKFAGRIFIYHETPLLPSKIAELTSVYEKNGLSSVFRGRDYLIMRNSPLYEGQQTPADELSSLHDTRSTLNTSALLRRRQLRERLGQLHDEGEKIRWAAFAQTSGWNSEHAQWLTKVREFLSKEAEFDTSHLARFNARQLEAIYEFIQGLED